MSEFDPDCIFEDEREEGRAEKPAAPFWTVAIYLVDLAYGGPEEGGWWYQTGQRIDHAIEGIPSEFIFNSFNPTDGLTARDVAVLFAGQVQGLLDLGINKDRREISSVLSEGRYHAQVYNGHPPAFYPEERPHYE